MADLPSRPAFIFQEIALALDVERSGVVQQLVKRGGSHHWGIENLAQSILIRFSPILSTNAAAQRPSPSSRRQR